MDLLWSTLLKSACPSNGMGTVREKGENIRKPKHVKSYQYAVSCLIKRNIQLGYLANIS